MDAIVSLLALGGTEVSWFFQKTPLWIAVGVLGQTLFASRFILQWIHSERRKELVVPPIFWHLSFWGSLITLVYAIHSKEAPFILGSMFLPFLYGRNLVLLYRKKEPAQKPKE